METFIYKNKSSIFMAIQEYVVIYDQIGSCSDGFLKYKFSANDDNEDIGAVIKAQTFANEKNKNGTINLKVENIYKIVKLKPDDNVVKKILGDGLDFKIINEKDLQSF
jgi:hypothetical protein